MKYFKSLENKHFWIITISPARCGYGTACLQNQYDILINPERVSLMATCLIDGEECVSTEEVPVVYKWVFSREALNNAWMEYNQNNDHIKGNHM